MRVQASAASPEHLPLRHSLPLHPQLVGGLEATYHREADPAGSAEAAEGRAQHRQPCPARASLPLQEQPRVVHQEGESLRLQLQEEKLMILPLYFLPTIKKIGVLKFTQQVSSSSPAARENRSAAAAPPPPIAAPAPAPQSPPSTKCTIRNSPRSRLRALLVYPALPPSALCTYSRARPSAARPISDREFRCGTCSWS